jgi:hypothetical protein
MIIYKSIVSRICNWHLKQKFVNVPFVNNTGQKNEHVLESRVHTKWHTQLFKIIEFRFCLENYS